MEWLLVIVALIVATEGNSSVEGAEGLRYLRWKTIARYTAAVLLCVIAGLLHAAERGWLR